MDYDVTAPEITVSVHNNTGLLGSEHCEILDNVNGWSDGSCKENFSPESNFWDLGVCRANAGISEEDMWNGVLWIKENLECTVTQTRSCENGWGECVPGNEIYDSDNTVIGCELHAKTLQKK